MFFKKAARDKEVRERALKQIDKVLKDMQESGLEITQMKLKKYQKTHFTSCRCPKCVSAKQKNNPHLRGLLEEGYKIFVGEGGSDE